MKGFFISLEGGEGSGKTTQLALLKDAFAKAKKDAVFTREPGGCPEAEAIRTLLLTGAGDKWQPLTEALLFQAARIEHVQRLIKPSLEAGKHVISDRFFDSTCVYQGHARGLGVAYMKALHQLTVGGFNPDLTIYIDITPEDGLKRASSRQGNETRFESLDISFHHKVREGFMQAAASEPQRFAVIDGAQTKEQVHAQIRAAMDKRLGLKL